MFLGIVDETCDRLRTVFGTANARTLPLSGTGSAGMEAAFVNTVGPGDVVVVAANGQFGERMIDVASRCGAEVVGWLPVGDAADAGSGLDAARRRRQGGRRRARRDVDRRTQRRRRPRGRKGDALVLADCVTSLGGIEVALDAWGVDLAYSGTQKCLGVSPGLAPLSLIDAAW